MIKHPQQIVIVQKEVNFDEACKSARAQALLLLGIDESGHSNRFPNIHRSESSIVIKFKGCEQHLSMIGTEIIYLFECGFEVE